MILSAIQFKKGLKYGDETYLVAIKEVQGDSPSVVPEVVVSILKDFIEIMSTELPRQLLPKHEVDPAIQLFSGTKLLAMALYQMALRNLDS